MMKCAVLYIYINLVVFLFLQTKHYKYVNENIKALAGFILTSQVVISFAKSWSAYILYSLHECWDATVY